MSKIYVTRVIRVTWPLISLALLTGCAHYADSISSEHDGPEPFLISKPVLDQPDSEVGVVQHTLNASSKTYPFGWVHDPNDKACIPALMQITIYDFWAPRGRWYQHENPDPGFDATYDSEGKRIERPKPKPRYRPPYSDESYLSCPAPDGSKLTPDDMPPRQGYWVYLRFPEIDSTWHIFDTDDKKILDEDRSNKVSRHREYYKFKIDNYHTVVGVRTPPERLFTAASQLLRKTAEYPTEQASWP